MTTIANLELPGFELRWNYGDSLLNPQAEVLRGLDAGDKIILYPGPGITDGARVRQRTIE